MSVNRFRFVLFVVFVLSAVIYIAKSVWSMQLENKDYFFMLITFVLFLVWFWFFASYHYLRHSIGLLEMAVISHDVRESVGIKTEIKTLPILELTNSINTMLFRIREKYENQSCENSIENITRLPNINWVGKNSNHVSVEAFVIFEIESINGEIESLKYIEYEVFIREFISALKSVLGEDVLIIYVEQGKYAVGLDSCFRIEHFVDLIKSIGTFPFEVSGNQIYVNFWFGSSAKTDISMRMVDLLDDAKLSLYESKRTMIRHVHFESSMRYNSQLKVSNYNRLKSAILNNEFMPYFQPIIDLETNSVVGAESLARWIDPERGVLGPIEFISLSEDTGLIDLIGLSILRESLIWFKNNAQYVKDANEFSLHVNVSIKQLMNRNFSKDVKDMIFSLGYSYKNVHFEFTESIYMESEMVMNNLNELSDLGIKFSIDDFGTGYSSFSYLRDIKFASLKIDRSFLSSENIEILRAMITMGSSLGCDIISEGVESKEQCDILKELGCKMAQGFYFEKPLSGKEFSEFIENSNCTTL
ncbi:EAL domain-containing protein [Vibrio scophthalmi]